MDALDFQIVRWLSADGYVDLWGGRRAIDPRVTIPQIARRVGLSETAVRLRLRALREIGLDRGTEVVVHPGLFGGELRVTDVLLPGNLRLEPLFDELGKIDGVLYARCLFRDAQRILRVYFVDDEAAPRSGRFDRISRLVPPGTLSAPAPAYVPSCSARPSLAEWELLQAMFRHPTLKVSEFAALLGWGAKATARRFARLLDGHAAWYTVAAEWEGGPWAVLSVDCADAAARARAERCLDREEGGWIPVRFGPSGPADRAAPAPFAATVLADGLSRAERVVQRLERLEGVLAVRRFLSLDSRSFRGWALARLDAAVDRTVAPAPAGAPSVLGFPRSGPHASSRVPASLREPVALPAARLWGRPR